MASAYLRKAHEGAGNRKTFTISAWVKRATLGGDHTIFSQGIVGGGYYSKLRIRSDNVLQYEDIPNAGNVNLKTNRLFRDITAWYHIVVRVDTTQSTEADRVRIYVNGNQITSFSTATYPAQDNNQQANENSSMSVTVGGRTAVNDGYWDGQMAHVHYSDGQSYAPSTFGETDSNGVWIPKTSPTVSYGVNGFFLKFDNDSNMGLDSSGQSHNLTTTGTIIQNKDTPTNNGTVINKLDRRTNDMTVTNAGNTGETHATVYTPGTMNLGADSGKWYWEIKVASKTGSSDWHMLGIMGQTRRENNVYLGQVVDQYGYYGLNGQSYTGGSGSTFGDTYGVGNIIGVAMDLDNNKLYFHKDGVYQNSGDPTSGSTGTGAISITAASATDDGFYRPAISYYDSSTKATYDCNFGNGYFGTTKITSAGSNGNGSLFEFDVPTGYYALNTKNLKEQS